MSTHRCLSGKFRRADKRELMTDNDWEILGSYRRQSEFRQRLTDDESAPSFVLCNKYGVVVRFEVQREWSLDAKRYDTDGNVECHEGDYVETDEVTITRHFPKPELNGIKFRFSVPSDSQGKPDMVWTASREWARQHYRALLADGYTKPSTR